MKQRKVIGRDNMANNFKENIYGKPQLKTNEFKYLKGMKKETKGVPEIGNSECKCPEAGAEEWCSGKCGGREAGVE